MATIREASTSTQFYSNRQHLRRLLALTGFTNSAQVTLDGPAGRIAALPISMGSLRQLAKGDPHEVLSFHVDIKFDENDRAYYRTFTVSGYQPEQ